MINIPQCFECKNYTDNLECKAYPNGIPEKILLGEVDHTKPYKGDNGIQFEAIK